MQSELEIALADTDTCAEQQGPALAVVIAYCMEMSHSQPRSGGQHAASLLHGAGRICRAQLGTVCLGNCCTSSPPEVQAVSSNYIKERTRMRASCSFLSS